MLDALIFNTIIDVEKNEALMLIHKSLSLFTHIHIHVHDIL